MKDLIDAAGIPLSEHRKWLPARAADFPRPKSIRNPLALKAFRWRFGYGKCWWCGSRTDCAGRRGEIHHMARHDAQWALAWLCDVCHRVTEEAVHKKNLYLLLKRKHEFDPDYTLWVPLAIGRGKFLPEEDGE